MRSPRPTRSSACLARASALLALHAGVDQRQLDVVQRVGARQQIERLEDEADLLVAHPRELAVVHRRHELAVQPVLAVVGRIEAADHVHQRRLARARRAHDRDVLAALHGEIDAAQRVNHLGAHLIVALQVVGPDRRVPWSASADRCVRRDYGIASPQTPREEV